MCTLCTEPLGLVVVSRASSTRCLGRCAAVFGPVPRGSVQSGSNSGSWAARGSKTSGLCVVSCGLSARGGGSYGSSGHLTYPCALCAPQLAQWCVTGNALLPSPLGCMVWSPFSRHDPAWYFRQ